MTYTPGAGFPDLATLRLEIQVPATVTSDAILLPIAGSEQANVQAGYDWGSGDLPDPLYQVFLRQVARSLSARQATLGMVAEDAEYGGVARLTLRDSEVTRVGGQFRKRTFA